MPPSKGKQRAKDKSEQVVSGSEEEDDIVDYTSSPYMERPPNIKKSPAIPNGIVTKTQQRFEGASAPAAILPAIMPHQGAPSIDLTSGTSITKRMKKKDETPGYRGLSDPIGTSSSNSINPSRQKEGVHVLPLEALCIGHHHFKQDNNEFLMLNYNRHTTSLTITLDRQARKFMLKLDRHVDHVWITNDEFAPLRANVVIQLQTIRGSNWKEHERRFEGFKGGGSRSNSGKLVFLFSTSKDRGFTSTRYQAFITDIRKVSPSPNAIDIIRPAGGRVLWTTAYEAAEMFEQTTTRKVERGHSEPPVMEPPVRFPTPCSSISIKSRTSRPDSKSPNSDSGPSVPPRFARYSVTQTMNTSPPPPPPPPSEGELYALSSFHK
ncbi:hypothetical protein BU15DRAFT_73619 [Melanogaster broomeanus]|nr:hypothetical protein BU15DRAFT_73619 [Melanogaster broomeanus]